MINVPISEELHDHFERIKQMADAALADPDESAAGKAAAMNSVTAIIKNLTTMQESLFNSERISLLQDAIVEALEEESMELKDRVIKLLEEKLATLS